MSKFSKGMTLYREDKKTKSIKTIKIVENAFKLDSRIGTKLILTQGELEDLIKEGEVFYDKEEYQRLKIKQLEEELGVSLQVKG